MTDKTPHPALPEAFAQLGIRNSVLRALADAQFTQPSEIQSLLIPRALAGADILGQARTGTGKTAAFGIPILCKAEKGLASQALILVPTRELAVQVEAEIQRLATHTPLRSVAVYGGQRITAQMKFLKHGPEVIVGTPGRVIDLLDRQIINLKNIRFIVLDEVDRMLDIGFRDDIRNILSRMASVRRKLQNSEDAWDDRQDSAGSGQQAAGSEEEQADDSSHLALSTQHSATSTQHSSDSQHSAPSTQHSPPPRVQTMFVSATISSEIEKLARRYMTEPVEKLIAPGSDDKPTVSNVEQWYVSVQPWDKHRALRQLIENENPELAIVFCKTKHGAEKLAAKLERDGIECREIHGNLNQSKRDRVMKNFRTGKFDVLVATDLASRGIDVADISHIINFDIPEDPEVYIHRVGRTARMGKPGKAFTFVGRDQGDQLTKVESLINMVIPQATIEGFDPRPTPSDWADRSPHLAPATPSPEETHTPAVPLPKRTLGSKTPITRRHRRRR